MNLPDDVIQFETMRAGGPGGQNADRRSTAVRLRVEIDDLPLSDEKKEWVRTHLPPRYRTSAGEILVENGESRSQKRNRKRAVEIAEGEIEKAIEQGRQEKKQRKRKKRIRRRGSGSSGDGEDRKEQLRKQRRSETTADLIEKAFREDPERMAPFVDDRGEEGEGRDPDKEETNDGEEEKGDERAADDPKRDSHGEQDPNFDQSG